VTCAVLRVGLGASVMAVATVVHAATPITLPFGDFGLQAGSGSALDLPVPPPPQVARPDLAQMRLVIRPQHPPCDKEYTRRHTGDRRQTVIEASTVAAPKPIRLG
jgi:hypothetical protein